MMCTALTDLPNEILFHILVHIPPQLTPAVLLVSKRFSDVAEPRLWRYHCRKQFRYWSQERRLRSQLFDDTDAVDWKKVFSERYTIDRKTSHILDSIIASQSGRIEKAEKIMAFGYDAKDTLLRHMRVSDEADDVLARRFHSNAVITSLHRKMAIQEWSKLRDDDQLPLERALTCFDMFILGDREGDFDYVSARLDFLARSVLDQTPEFADLTSRQKARVIALFLKERILAGLKNDGNNYELHTNFIGLALQDRHHPTMPLIYVAIYCCVAQRLGLRAQPCGFPFHVLAIIKPTEGFDMDGKATRSPEGAKAMYMDPFRSTYEVPVFDLQNRLAAMGLPMSEREALLDSSSTIDIILRTARNIINAIKTTQSHPHTGLASLAPLSINSASARYGAHWALLLLPEKKVSELMGVLRAHHLQDVMGPLRDQFFMDVGLIEPYILPIFRCLRPFMARDTVGPIRASESEPKTAKRRTQAIRTKVKYHVGQVFSHIRYHYQAVIIGWDVECGASEEWISQMRVDNLDHGRRQSFYQVLVDDGSIRYVAEENISLQNPDEPRPELTKLAGRFFKRWDSSRRIFVSNIKDEYPDD